MTFHLAPCDKRSWCMLQASSLPKARRTAGHLLGSKYSLPLTLILRELHTCMDIKARTCFWSPLPGAARECLSSLALGPRLFWFWWPWYHTDQPRGIRMDFSDNNFLKKIQLSPVWKDKVEFGKTYQKWIELSSLLCCFLKIEWVTLILYYKHG